MLDIDANDDVRRGWGLTENDLRRRALVRNSDVFEEEDDDMCVLDDRERSMMRLLPRTRSCMTARFALPYTDAVANSSSLPAPTHDCCRSENRHISDSVGGKAAKMRVRRNATSSAFTHVSQVRRTRATASGT